jgi:hypothetical protein
LYKNSVKVQDKEIQEKRFKKRDSKKEIQKKRFKKRDSKKEIKHKGTKAQRHEESI